MDAERTIYIGSFFEWTDEGKNEFIKTFRNNYHDKDSVPFVSYDKSNHVFCIKTDDPLARTVFISTLDDLIDKYQGRLQDVDILTQPLFTPIESTILPDADTTCLAEPFGVYSDLITIADDSDEDSTDNTSSGGVPSLYWTPRSGNIGILLDHVAMAIVDVSDCMLHKEPDSKRVRLMNGDIHGALEKLHAVEPLLECLAQHPKHTASVVNSNHLSFSSQLPGTGIVYSTAFKSPHRERIMVPTALQNQLESLQVGEEYIWDEKKLDYIRSSAFSETRDRPIHARRASKLWEGQKTPSYGNLEYARPKDIDEGSRVNSASVTQPSVSSTVDVSSRFMQPADQARLREWSRNVDITADPESPAYLATEPAEAAVPIATTRRVALDSDSENGEAAGDSVIKKRAVMEDSDDEKNGLESPSPSPTQDPIQQAYRSHLRARKPDVERNVQKGNANTREAGRIPPTAFWDRVPRHEESDEMTESHGSKKVEKPESRRYDDIRAPDQQQTSLQQQRRRVFGLDGTHEEIRDLPQAPTTPNPRPQNAHRESIVLSAGSRKSQGQAGISGSSPFEQSQYNSTTQGPRNPSATQNYSSDRQARPTNDFCQSPVASDSTPHRNGNADQARPNQLVDTSDRSHDIVNLRPPPGLDIRIPGTTHNMERPTLDGDPDEIQPPPIHPVRADLRQCTNDQTSLSNSSSNSSGLVRGPRFSYLPQTKIQQPDVNGLHDMMLQQLLVVKETRQGPSNQNGARPAQKEKIAEEDESLGRRFYQSMNLKAPNPKGRKGKSSVSKSSTTETPAQKAERTARAMVEAYGAPKAQLKMQTSQQRHKDELAPSKRALDAAKKNSSMAAAQADVLAEKSRHELAERLFKELTPNLCAAACFPGKLSLEVQIGQLLVSSHPLVKTGRAIKQGRWASIFETTDARPSVFFSNLVTNDGADVDGVLEMKSSVDKRQKAWNRENAALRETLFEIQCVDNSGHEFEILLATDGTHVLHRGLNVIAKHAIHCPGRVWDACAILSGIFPWRHVPEALENAVATLIGSVCITSEKGPTLFFRLPSDNSMSVRDVIMKRCTTHDSTASDHQNIQLKITEAKKMYTRGHKKDKQLHVSSVKDHETMAVDQRIHYELAIIDIELHNAFRENLDLQVGEACRQSSVSETWTAERSKRLVDSALDVIDKIDWVGANNEGDLSRLEEERNRQRQTLQSSLPPTASNLQLPGRFMMHPGTTIAGPRTGAGTRGQLGAGAAGRNVPLTIHGIRTGTTAQIYQDAYGNSYRLGQGGARIPVVDDQEQVLSQSEIGPHESASQAGRRPTRVARGQVAGFEAKPAGFW